MKNTPAQVGPQVGLLRHHLGDPGHLDALDVGDAAARGQPGLQRGQYSSSPCVDW
jgi:hypothetical protein